MPIENYSNTVIYKIHCKNPAVKYVYFGATTDCVKMRYRHKRCCNAAVSNELYKTINANGGWDNWIMTILEHFDECTCKRDSNLRVQYWQAHELPHKPSQNLTNPSGLPPNPSGLPPNPSGLPPNPSGLPPNPSGTHLHSTSSQEPDNKEERTNLECMYCNKQFSRRDNLVRHEMQRCKSAEDYRNILEELRNHIIEQGKQIIGIKQQIDEKDRLLTEKDLRIKTQEQEITALKTAATTQVSKPQNTPGIVPHGDEDFSSILTPEEKIHILDKRYSALTYRIKYCHFNTTYRQFMNVFISNLRESVAHVFDENAQDYIVKASGQVVEDLVQTHLDGIIDDFEEMMPKLSQQTIERTGNFISQMNENTDNRRTKIKQDVKLALYNEHKHPISVDAKIKQIVKR